MKALIPRQKTPDLELATLDGSTWRLSGRTPGQFTMIVAYRGLHCPICTTYIKELNRHVADFERRGVDVIAVSCDTHERAAQSQSDWGLDRLTVGYEMGIPKAREWGLYISSSRGKTSTGVLEPDLFSEPGLFLVRPDQTLYAAAVATMPFARPHFREILAALDFVVEKDYPARGEA